MDMDALIEEEMQPSKLNSYRSGRHNPKNETHEVNKLDTIQEFSQRSSLQKNETSKLNLGTKTRTIKNKKAAK